MYHVQGTVESECIVVWGDRVVTEDDSLNTVTNRARLRSKQMEGAHEVYRMETKNCVSLWVLKKTYVNGKVGYPEVQTAAAK